MSDTKNGAGAPTTPDPVRLDQMAEVVVPMPDGTLARVPGSVAHERWNRVSALEQQLHSLTQASNQNARLAEIGRRVASKSSDPEAAAAEARRLAAEISGIPNAPVMPQLDEANLDPTMKVLLQMVRAQGEALTELRTERVSARAQESVDDALSKFPLFQNDKGSRDLGALVSLALLKDNPTADVNEVAAHVHGLIGKVTQSQITKAREARESANGAPVVPAGSGLVSFSPPETPMTVKEAKSGAMADAIRSALKKFQGGITPG